MWLLGVSEGYRQHVALAGTAVAHFDGNAVVAERLRRGSPSIRLDHVLAMRDIRYALIACTGWIRALGGERVGLPEKSEKPEQAA